MSAKTLTHPDCAEVARLVAEQIAVIEQTFAHRVADVLDAMQPRVDSLETRIVADSFAAAARTVLRLADLGEAGRDC